MKNQKAEQTALTTRQLNEMCDVTLREVRQ